MVVTEFASILLISYNLRFRMRFLSFCILLFQSIHNLILDMLKIDPEERPFIDEVKSKANTILTEIDSDAVC